MSPERLVAAVSICGLLAIAAVAALMLAHVVAPLFTVLFSGIVAGVVMLTNTAVANRSN